MSTLRRRVLATAILPAAALGFLLAAPGAASASTPHAARPASAAADGHHRHHHGLDLDILLGLHLGLGDDHDGGCWHGGLLDGGLLDLR